MQQSPLLTLHPTGAFLQGKYTDRRFGSPETLNHNHYSINYKKLSENSVLDNRRRPAIITSEFIDTGIDALPEF